MGYRYVRRALGAAMRAVLTTAGLLAGSVGTAGAAADGDRLSHTGAIDGTAFRVEVPENWNGTLLLYSHGYIPPEFDFGGIPLSHRPDSERWLLEHGYALAGSEYEGRVGFALKEAIRDQVAVLDWFAQNVGEPKRTYGNGFSMGGGIAVRLAERYPHRFDGVLATGASLDEQHVLNRQLDIAYAVQQLLLTPAERAEAQLVEQADPMRSVALLQQGVQRALTSKQGRAKLAMAGALGNVAPWYSAHDPKPTTLEAKIRAQASWTEFAYLVGFGGSGRADIERRAGGNPSFNIGVDYAKEFARSAERGLAVRAYRAAGIDPRTDLATLAKAPRIAPDPRAVAYMYRWAVGFGTLRDPLVTLHNTGDGGAPADEVRWYTDRLKRAGKADLARQLWVDRGFHGAFSAADEIVALRTLFHRDATGRWTDTSPPALNRGVAAFPAELQLVNDLNPENDRRMPPAFVRYTAPPVLRPSL